MLAKAFSAQGVAIVALVGYIIYRLCAQLARQRKLPPGPKPLLIVGNVRDFPPPGVPEFQHWLHHKDRYGPISSVTVLGNTIVIVHDKNAAHDILERAASKTSGRPSMTFSSELCGYDQAVNFRGYDDGLRRARKMIHQELGTKVLSAKFYDVQEAEACRQLVRTLEEPQELLKHFRTTTGSIILKSVYGYSIDVEKPDFLVGMTDKVMTQFSKVAVPMTWAVDIFPILQHVPEWFPGAGFHQVAKECKRCCRENVYTPYGFVERQMAAGAHRPSFVSRLIEHCRPDGEKTTSISHENRESIAWSAATMYVAAADTTVLSLTAFTLAMIKFPEVQQKAQAEIDGVVGTNRLPTIEDRDKLPYVNALVKEVQRWWPVVPMGFPHTVDEDLEYNGMLIPKGAYLMPNVWWFLHDPEVHPDPESFEPERFLEPRNEPDPMSEAFGYGRRICPGRFFADSSLFLDIVKLLATFTIHKALGPDGTEIDLNPKPEPGLLSSPSEFPFRVTPRSSQHVELIRQAGLKYPEEPTDAGFLEVMTE